MAQRIGPRLAKAAVAAKVDGVVTDLARPLHKDVQLEILTTDSPEGLEVLRHSTAHLMAQAIRRLFPGTKLAIGPVVGERFYYDIDCPKSLTVEDFEAIEKEMAKIVEENLPINREEDQQGRRRGALSLNGRALKLEILEGLQDGEISLYRQGEFVDLCRGPHVPSTGYIRRLNCSPWPARIGGATAAAQCCNESTAPPSPSKVSLRSTSIAWRRPARRDHRRLGPALGLFTFHEESPGFAYWQPKGLILYRELENFSRELQEARGYQEVATPWISRSKLWEQSGHWHHYKENMFCMEYEDEILAVKPMNCPNHCLMYKEEPARTGICPSVLPSTARSRGMSFPVRCTA